MNIAELFVRVRGDTSDLTRKMSAAEKSVERFGKAAGKWLGLGIAGGFALMVKESIEAQHSLAQLEARIKSTGGAAGRSIQQLTAHASALQKITTFSNEAVQGAQALLLTFKNIRGGEFDRATKAALDLATALGTDVKSAALQLGKALEDPVRGMTALRRSGVSFSKDQEEVIKKLVQTGKVAEAQNMILAEMETQFGGAAEAARNTLGGALTGLRNAFLDTLKISRESSDGIVAAINKMADNMPNLFEKMTRGATVFRQELEYAGLAVGGVAARLQQLWGWMQLIASGGKSLAGAIDVAAGGQMRDDIGKAIDRLRREKDILFGGGTVPSVLGDVLSGATFNPRGGARSTDGVTAGLRTQKTLGEQLSGTFRDQLRLMEAMNDAQMDTASIAKQLEESYARINDLLRSGTALSFRERADLIRAQIDARGALANRGGPGAQITIPAGPQGFGNVVAKGLTAEFDPITGTFKNLMQRTAEANERQRVAAEKAAQGVSVMATAFQDATAALTSSIASILGIRAKGGIGGGIGSAFGGAFGTSLGGQLFGGLMGGKGIGGALKGALGGILTGGLGALAGAAFGSIGSAIGKLFGKGKKVDQTSDALERFRRELDRITTGLHNVPAAFKRERWINEFTPPTSIPPRPGGPEGGIPGGPGGPGVLPPPAPNYVFTGDVNIGSVADWDDFTRKLDRHIESELAAGKLLVSR